MCKDRKATPKQDVISLSCLPFDLNTRYYVNLYSTTLFIPFIFHLFIHPYPSSLSHVSSELPLVPTCFTSMDHVIIKILLDTCIRWERENHPRCMWTSHVKWKYFFRVSWLNPISGSWKWRVLFLKKHKYNCDDAQHLNPINF